MKTNKSVIFSLIVLFFSVLAIADEISPQQVVQTTVDELLADLKTNKETYRQNPAAFHQTLLKILAPVVDTDGIARGVMTIKYTRKASPEQIERFKTNFEQGLMQFYGNALLEYENQGIRVLRTTPSDSPDRVTVAMEIDGSNNVVYPVNYTMVRIDGRWLLRNVIVNGLNIGKLFRDQFANEMKNNNNDLNKVIDNWADVVKRTKESQNAD